MSNTIIIPISLSRELARKVDLMAKEEDKTRSEFVSELIRRRAAFAEFDTFREEFSRRAKKSGLRTLSDAVRAVRELRDGKLKRRKTGKLINIKKVAI